MPTLFAQLYETQWPGMLTAFGETVVYKPYGGANMSLTGIIAPRSDTQVLDATWEVQARQAEVLIDADSLTGVTFSPRQDTITARGVTYTAMERDDHNGAVYRFRCEREDVDAIAMRGRRY